MSDVRSCLHSPLPFVLRARRLCCERLALPGDASYALAHPEIVRLGMPGACVDASTKVPGGQIGHALKRTAARDA